MKIHHATAARAEKAGIVLQVVESTSTGQQQAKAIWPKRNKHFVADDPKTALALAMLQQRFGDEYANVTVTNDHTTTVGDVTLVEFEEGFDEDEVFAETLEQMLEEGIEAEEAEEEGASGNVVPVRYRQKYAEAGHPNTCGDWLAKILIDECTALDVDGKPRFDVGRFDAIYDENKGDRNQKWCKNTSGRGWEGRYRMSGRIALAKVVGINGYLVLDGAKLVPPTEWLAKHAQKPKPAKAKKAA